MSAPHWYCCVLLLSAAGCGWLGLRLVDADAGVHPRDSGAQPLDAGVEPRSGSGGGSGSGGSGSGGSGSGGSGSGGSGSGGSGSGGSGSGSGSGSGGEGAVDAGPPYGESDAATTTPDAGAAVDAGTTPSCGGALQFGLCWYLADADTSCNEECADKGGFDTRAISIIGTSAQGGSRSECAQVLGALGLPANATAGTQPQDGLGCHVWNNGDRWWIDSPAFSPDAASPNGTGARIACACLR